MRDFPKGPAGRLRTSPEARYSSLEARYRDLLALFAFPRSPVSLPLKPGKGS
jgi:hypothetical protein